MRAAVAFRFDAINHEYLDLETGAILPHITGMLQAAGLIDDTWFTEESSYRGQRVHRLTADYDLGAIEKPETVEDKYKAYFLAHVKAMKILRPTFLAVEQPFVHPVYRYGGRPDRLAVINRAKAVLEIKTAIPAKSHPIQTALQAILAAGEFGLPPEGIQRLCLYVTKTGKFKLEEHRDRGDFDQARRVIRQCCSRAA